MRHRSLSLVVLVATFGGGVAHAQEPVDSEAAPALTGTPDRSAPRQLPDRDGRRTLAAFPRNLGKSFAGVFSRDNLVPLAIGVASASTAYRGDARAQDFFSGRASAFGKAGATAGGFGVMAPLTLTLFAAGHFSGDTRLKAFTYDATQAVIVSSVYTNLLKQVAHRERPDGSNRLAFPSGHTSNAFAWATVARKHYGWKVGVPSYLAAGAIGLSRIERGKHHLSDVLAGATLGVIAGRTVVRENGAPTGRGFSVTLVPARDAQGTGAGLGASVSW